jgi:hypothetical protein|tara:strand:- start:3960 stop:4265 length:306 start_codon:yes stop_codon:yes gene_type:complete
MDSINNEFLRDEELGITEIDILKQENNRLRLQLNEVINKNKNWSQNIDNFVDKWFETNEENISIGTVTILYQEIDLFPNWLEKIVYKKMLKIVYSFFKEIF